MCIFKKKKKEVEVIDSLYHKGDLVAFKRHNDVSYGFIYEVKKNENGEVIYDIQIGGECPTIIPSVIESKVMCKK